MAGGRHLDEEGSQLLSAVGSSEADVASQAVERQGVEREIGRLLYQVWGSFEGFFQSADKEKRGWLTIPEIRAQFKECSVPLPEEELQELCEELAHGEAIPYEAVLQRFQVHDLRPNVARALQRIRLELFRRKECLEEEFHRMDTRVGGYGALTMGELMSDLQRRGIRIGWMDFLELFRYADSDGNGLISLEEFNRAFLLADFQPDWNGIDMATLRGAFYKVWSKRMDLLRGFSTYDDECNGKVGVEEFKDCLESSVADISEDEMVDMLKTCEVWQSHIDYGLWLDIVNYSVAGDDWLHGGAGESLQMLNSELFENTSECHKWFEAADVRGVGVLDEDSFFRKLIGFRVGLPLDTVSTLAQEFWNADFHGVDYNELIMSRIAVDPNRVQEVAKGAIAKLQWDEEEGKREFAARADKGKGTMTRLSFYDFCVNWAGATGTEAHALLAAMDIPVGANVTLGDLTEALEGGEGEGSLPLARRETARMHKAREMIATRNWEAIQHAEGQAREEERNQGNELVGWHSLEHPSRGAGTLIREAEDATQFDDDDDNVEPSLDHIIARSQAASQRIIREILKLRPQPQRATLAALEHEQAVRYVARMVRELTGEEVAAVVCGASGLWQYQDALANSMPGSRLVRLGSPCRLAQLGIQNHKHQRALFAAIKELRSYHDTQEVRHPDDPV